MRRSRTAPLFCPVCPRYTVLAPISRHAFIVSEARECCSVPLWNAVSLNGRTGNGEGSQVSSWSTMVTWRLRMCVRSRYFASLDDYSAEGRYGVIVKRMDLMVRKTVTGGTYTIGFDNTGLLLSGAIGSSAELDDLSASSMTVFRLLAG